MLNQRTCKPVRQLSDRTVVTPFDSAYTHKQICTWLAVVRIKVLGLLAGLGHDGSFEQTVDWVNLRAGIKACTHSVNEASFSSSSLPQTPRTFHSFLTTAFISAPLKRKHTSSHTELCSNFWQTFSRINNNKACFSRPPELLFTCAKNYCSQSSCAPITPQLHQQGIKGHQEEMKRRTHVFNLVRASVKACACSRRQSGEQRKKGSHEMREKARIPNRGQQAAWGNSAQMPTDYHHSDLFQMVNADMCVPCFFIFNFYI